MLPRFDPFVVIYLYLKKRRRRILKLAGYFFLAFLLIAAFIYVTGNLNLWLNVKGLKRNLKIEEAIRVYIEETDVNFPYRLPDEYEALTLNLDALEFQAKYPGMMSLENRKVAFPLKSGKGRWLNLKKVSLSILKKAIVENLVKARISILSSRPEEAEKFLLASIPLFEAAFVKEYRVLWPLNKKFFNFCSGRFSSAGVNPYCFLNPEPSKLLLLYRMEMHLWLVYSLSVKRNMDLETKAKIIILNNSAELFFRVAKALYFNGVHTLFLNRWDGARFLIGGKKYRMYAALLQNGYFPIAFDFTLNRISFSGELGYFDLPALRKSFEFYLPVLLAVEDVKKRRSKGREVVSRKGYATVSLSGDRWRIVPSPYLSAILLESYREPAYYDISLHFLLDYWNLRKNGLKY